MFAIESLKNQAQQLVGEYNNVYQAAANAVIQLHNFVQAEQQAAAAYQATAASYENMIRRMQAANAAYVSNPLGNYSYSGGDSSGGGGSSGSGGSGSGGSGSGSSSGRGSNSASGNKGGYAYYTGSTGKVTYTGHYRYASGGYTGDWGTDDPKLAFIDRKEIVLNKDDTKNFLEGTYILREISSSLEGSLNNRMNGIGIKFNNSKDKDEIQQNVHIDATFPNVDSKREIEEALSDLVNLAAQRVLHK